MDMKKAAPFPLSRREERGKSSEPVWEFGGGGPARDFFGPAEDGRSRYPSISARSATHRNGKRPVRPTRPTFPNRLSELAAYIEKLLGAVVAQLGGTHVAEVVEGFLDGVAGGLD
jgi:hypothetical protein